LDEGAIGPIFVGRVCAGVDAGWKEDRMKWQVHGTDEGTGRPVTLGVEHAEAMEAVKSALSKRILVRYVIGGGGLRFRALAFPALCVGAVVLMVACGILYWQRSAARADRGVTKGEARRLNGLLADSAGTIAGLQERIGSLEKAENGAGRELLDQLEAAKQRRASVETELAEARGKLVELDKAARAASGLHTQVAAAKQKLAAAEGRVAQLEKQKKELGARVEAAAGAVKMNKELSAEVDLLKSQLLVQVAKGEAPAVIVPVESAVVSRSMRWGLRTSFDQAKDFMALYFPRDGMSSSAGAEGTLVTTAVWAANAAAMRVVHDGEKQRVYAATLTLPLAGDGPKEKVAENLRLVGAFVRAFAPSFNEPEAWTAEAVNLLAGKESGQRMVRVGEDFKLTVWNTGQGGYSFRMDSPRGEVE
jgi:hypothetical protein